MLNQPSSDVKSFIFCLLKQIFIMREFLLMEKILLAYPEVLAVFHLRTFLACSVYVLKVKSKLNGFSSTIKLVNHNDISS